MSERSNATQRRQAAPKVGYECSRCRKLLTSPEAGEAHLQNKHHGHGFLSWQDYRRKA